MKAATTRRPCLPAWARTLRMKCTRQRCQEACSTLATAALSPSWASEITSLMPRRPRLASERRNSIQGLGLGGADRHAQHLTPAVIVDGDSNDDRDRDDATAGADLHIGRIEPEIGPVALQRPIEKRGDLVVDLTAQSADLAFRDARHAHGFDQIIDRACRHAVHISLLDNRGEGFLGQAPRLQKHREVAALAQLWDAQLDRPGAGLPDPVSVAIAVIDAVRAALAVRR